MIRIVKTALIMVIMAIGAICFTGCVEEVTVSMVTGSDGSVTREYRVFYNATSADATIVAGEINKVMTQIADNLISKGRNAVIVEEGDYVILRERYSSITDYNIALGYTGDEPNEASSSENDGYFKIYTSENDSYLTAKNINDVINMIDEEYVAQAVLTADFYYQYGTPYSNISSNADNTYEKDGVYYHEWALDISNPEKIILYQKVPNVAAWWLTGIAVGLLALGIISLMIWNKSSRIKKRIADIEQEDKVKEYVE